MSELNIVYQSLVVKQRSLICWITLGGVQFQGFEGTRYDSLSLTSYDIGQNDVPMDLSVKMMSRDSYIHKIQLNG